MTLIKESPLYRLGITLLAINKVVYHKEHPVILLNVLAVFTFSLVELGVVRHLLVIIPDEPFINHGLASKAEEQDRCKHYREHPYYRHVSARLLLTHTEQSFLCE